MSLSGVLREIFYGINAGHAIRHGLAVEQRPRPGGCGTLAATTATPTAVEHPPASPVGPFQPPEAHPRPSGSTARGSTLTP